MVWRGGVEDEESVPSGSVYSTTNHGTNEQRQRAPRGLVCLAHCHHAKRPRPTSTVCRVPAFSQQPSWAPVEWAEHTSSFPWSTWPEILSCFAAEFSPIQQEHTEQKTKGRWRTALFMYVLLAQKFSQDGPHPILKGDDGAELSVLCISVGRAKEVRASRTNGKNGGGVLLSTLSSPIARNSIRVAARFQHVILFVQFNPRLCWWRGRAIHDAGSVWARSVSVSVMMRQVPINIIT